MSKKQNKIKLGLKVMSIAVLAIVFAFAFPPTKQVVVIDASHGGKDIGAVYNNLTEKTISLALAKQLKAKVTNKNVDLVLLRTEDVFLSIEERVKKINSLNPSMVLSLHVNTSSNTDASGVEVFVPQKGNKVEQSTKIATDITTGFAMLGIPSKASKKADFKILNESNTPAVLLEIGYLSNKGDRENLLSAKGQQGVVTILAAYINNL